MSYLRVLLISTIAVLMVHEGETIKCWSCQSNAPDGAGCSDPFRGSADVKDDDMFIRECEKEHNHLQLLPNGTTRTDTVSPEVEFVCLKMTAKILGSPTVMRMCALGLPNITRGSCMYAEPQKITGGNILKCDACAGDLCNGAGRMGAMAVLFAPLLLLLA